MKISAALENSFQHHSVTVQSNGIRTALPVPGKPAGFGSAVNGGELLCLALATCFCNAVYREAAKRNIRIYKVTVEATADFSEEGGPAKNIQYKVRLDGDASDDELEALVRITDQASEVQNTLRTGVQVTLIK